MHSRGPRRALAAYEHALGKKRVELTHILTLLAGVHVSRGNPGEAEPLLHRALAIREKRLGMGHPDVAAGLYRLALVQIELGRGGEAMVSLERALKISSARRSRDPELRRKLHRTLARYHAAQGRYARAAGHWVEAISILEAAADASRADLREALQAYGERLRSAGRDREADAVEARLSGLGGGSH